jgi:hypothetical protein
MNIDWMKILVTFLAVFIALFVLRATGTRGTI